MKNYFYLFLICVSCNNSMPPETIVSEVRSPEGTLINFTVKCKEKFNCIQAEDLTCKNTSSKVDYSSGLWGDEGLYSGFFWCENTIPKIR